MRAIEPYRDRIATVSLCQALEMPRARNGIQVRLPICSWEAPRSALRYFGIQNM